MVSQFVEVVINKVQVAVRRDDDAEVFVAFCPRFQVYSQAETKEEAIEAVSSAITLKIVTAYDHGRIDKVVRQAGFERLGPGITSSRLPPELEFVSLDFKQGVEVSEIGIRVPIGALLQSRNNECQH